MISCSGKVSINDNNKSSSSEGGHEPTLKGPRKHGTLADYAVVLGRARGRLPIIPIEVHSSKAKREFVYTMNKLFLFCAS